MIRPTDPDLLNGVAASLEQTVLPDLARGTAARRQLQAAIAILRRMAFALPQRAAAIEADCADMAETLERIAGEALATTLAGLPNEVEARHLVLQDAVAALADVPDVLIRSELTALYRRMTDRQMALILPDPTGKKPGSPA